MYQRLFVCCLLDFSLSFYVDEKNLKKNDVNVVIRVETTMRFKANTYSQRDFRDFESLSNSSKKSSDHDLEHELNLIVSDHDFTTHQKTIQIANDKRKIFLN